MHIGFGGRVTLSLEKISDSDKAAGADVRWWSLTCGSRNGQEA